MIDGSGHGSDLYVGSPEIVDAVRAFLRVRPTPPRLALDPLALAPPHERSLTADVLDRLRRDGFESTARWYRNVRIEHARDRTYDFSSGVLNRLGYDLLAAGHVDLAVDVFRLNVIGHPDAFNPWDSLGEGYMNAGRREKSIEAYEKSLELNPANDNARRMLERLRGS